MDGSWMGIIITSNRNNSSSSSNSILIEVVKVVVVVEIGRGCKREVLGDRLEKLVALAKFYVNTCNIVRLN